MRAFIAINLDPAVRERLYESARPLRDMSLPVRWVPAENLHLTLKFLGEVEENRRPGIESAVGEALSGYAAFDLALEGFGAFPSLRRPRVLWVGIHPAPTLEAVQAAVESAMSELGFPRETRDFHPHLTLGRVRRDTSPSRFMDLPGAVGQLSYAGTTTVRSVDLMRSRLSPAGAEYEVLYSAPLEG